MIHALIRTRRLAWLCLFLVVMLCVTPQLYLLWQGKAITHWFKFGLFPALLLVALLLSLSDKLHKSIWALLPLALLAPQELFYLSHYQKPTDAHAMAIIAETDLAEAAGYLSGLGGLLTSVVIGILLLFALTAAQLKVVNSRWSRYGRKVVWGATVLGLIWVADQERWYANQYPIEQKATAEETALSRRPLPQSYNLFYQSYPLNLLLSFAEYQKQQWTLEAVAAKSKDFKFNAGQPELIGERQIYVLVIGETVRPDHLQLNGYTRETTPKLSKERQLVSFKDMVSPWAWTRMSVPVIVSRKPASDHSYYFAEKSLVAAFKEAGFYTSWLSTQSPLGVHDSSVALHASEADEVSYLNPVGYRKEGVYDGVLIDAVANIVKQNRQKQLIVIHTLGSHFSYPDRYPMEFDRFKPSGKGEKLAMHDPAQREMLVNAYDNSIRYTDFVLSGMIKQLDQQGAVSSLLYLSDHGENLFDQGCDKSGHGHNTERDYRVGAFWWRSSLFDSTYPLKTAAMKAAATKPLLTSYTFDTMLDLAGVRYVGERLTQSYASPQFTPAPRLLANGVDFDRAPRSGACLALPEKSTKK